MPTEEKAETKWVRSWFEECCNGLQLSQGAGRHSPLARGVALVPSRFCLKLFPNLQPSLRTEVFDRLALQENDDPSSIVLWNCRDVADKLCKAGGEPAASLMAESTSRLTVAIRSAIDTDRELGSSHHGSGAMPEE